MTERQAAYQLDFSGNPVAADDHTRAVDLLTAHEEARGDRQLALFWWWMDYDDLEAALGAYAAMRFRTWITTATPAKTVCNRVMEVQAERPDLDAPPEVRRQWDWRARAGVPR